MAMPAAFLFMEDDDARLAAMVGAMVLARREPGE